VRTKLRGEGERGTLLANSMGGKKFWASSRINKRIILGYGQKSGEHGSRRGRKGEIRKKRKAPV